MDEKEIIENIKDGQIDAFNLLFEKYSKKAVRTAYLITGRKDICEDIVQETFIQCYHEIKNLKNHEAFKAWFYKILTRISWRYCSKNKVEVSIDNINDKYTDTLSHDVEKNEMKNLVGKSVDKLPLPMKAAVILYYYNELSIKDISGVLGCFQGTVKSRLYNARKLLEKDFMKKDFEGYSFQNELKIREENKNARAKTV